MSQGIIKLIFISEITTISVMEQLSLVKVGVVIDELFNEESWEYLTTILDEQSALFTHLVECPLYFGLHRKHIFV